MEVISSRKTWVYKLNEILVGDDDVGRGAD